MDGLDRVDFLPEPSDRRILTAIDPSTAGYHDEWRAEVTGWAPQYAEPCLLYTSPSPRDQRGSRMPSSA